MSDLSWKKCELEFLLVELIAVSKWSLYERNDYHTWADNREPEFKWLHVKLLFKQVLEGLKLEKQNWKKNI